MIFRAALLLAIGVSAHSRLRAKSFTGPALPSFCSDCGCSMFADANTSAGSP